MEKPPEGEPRSSDVLLHDFFAPSLSRATTAVQQLTNLVADGSADHMCADALARQMQGASLHESHTERMTRGMAQGRRTAAAAHNSTPLREERRTNNESLLLDGLGCRLDSAGMRTSSEWQPLLPRFSPQVNVRQFPAVSMIEALDLAIGRSARIHRSAKSYPFVSALESSRRRAAGRTPTVPLPTPRGGFGVSLGISKNRRVVRGRLGRGQDAWQEQRHERESRLERTCRLGLCGDADAAIRRASRPHAGAHGAREAAALVSQFSKGLALGGAS